MIARMSKYDFVLFAAQSADFVDRLRDLGLVDITTAGWEPSEEDRQLLLDIEAGTKALDFLKAWAGESEHNQTGAQPYASGEETFRQYAAAQRALAASRTEIARLEKSAEELRPWGEFDVARVQKLAGQGIVLRYFSAQRNTYDKMSAEWSEQYAVSEINRTDSTVWFIVVAAPGQEINLDAQEMKTPQMDVRQAGEAIAAEQAKVAALDAEFARAAASRELLAAYVASLKERLQGVKVEATARQAADGTLVVMEGWAETETSAKVDALLEEYPNVVYIKSDPTPEDNTPVKLKNGWFARIFELVGDMYARPKYGTLDLTPFFAPFYMLFFGICLNDAGYGLILLGMGLWLLRKNPKPGMMRQAAWFATMCAAATILFGLFCGSFFGMNLKDYFPSIPFFDFQGQFFSIALAIGMVQILFGMLISVVVTARTFGVRYSLGTMGWFIILLAASVAGGLPMLNEKWVIPGFTTSSVAFYVVLGIGAVLMLFFNTPGRNPLLNLGSGVWNFYNNLTGLLSDVLSYIRLFAIGLSGGVLALVFNSLAEGFVPDGANIVVRILIMLPILLIGHGINLFMSTISSFVHPMRLTFVEFYKNAGFEMATRNFEPLQKVKGER
ncbi:V-type ATP synthase subunit I [uncultured Alistipes sp.]|uniref:V-type ATP synthase subunit I n=2 Tax=uncultured Alistipes sp. TaxID=538949 RepID=UPI0025997434|nr:V-type ATP synthase subunit I [uncultured Alistipes sp.]